MNPILIVASLAAAGFITGCSGGAQPSSHTTSTAASIGGVQRVTLHATDGLRFTPDVISVHPGQVRVTLVDDGSYPHNFSIASLHVTSATVSGNPSDTSTTTILNLTKPGTYQFVCTFHASAGMRGEIVVT